jgi:hypothetical protein
MAATPQILKVVTFTLGASDFSDDALDVEMVPTPGDVQSVTTLDGVTHQDVAAPTFAIRVRMVVDWDTVRPGLAYYLWNNQGDEVACVFADTTAAASTTKPQLNAQVKLVPVGYGGTGNEFAEQEVLLPITGAVTVDTT